MRRLIILAVAVVACIAAGASVATALRGDDVDPMARLQREVEPDGSGASIPVTAADPSRSRYRLAVRVYRSQTGLTCPQAARTDGDNFGQLDESGRFQKMDIAAAGACTDLTKQPLTAIVDRHPAIGDEPAYVVVYGVVSDEVQSLTITLGGATQPVEIANGAYIVPTTEQDLLGSRLDWTLTDGSSGSRALVPAGSGPTP